MYQCHCHNCRTGYSVYGTKFRYSEHCPCDECVYNHVVKPVHLLLVRWNVEKQKQLQATSERFRRHYRRKVSYIKKQLDPILIRERQQLLFQWIVEHNKLQLAKWLLEYGVDPNLPCARYHDWTKRPMMYYITEPSYSFELFQLFIEYGVDIHSELSYNETPLEKLTGMDSLLGEPDSDEDEKEHLFLQKNSAYKRIALLFQAGARLRMMKRPRKYVGFDYHYHDVAVKIQTMLTVSYIHFARNTHKVGHVGVLPDVLLRVLFTFL